MYITSNPPGRKAFKKREFVIKSAIFSFLVITVTGHVIFGAGGIYPQHFVQNLMIFVAIPIMIITSAILLRLLKTKYHFEYEIQKKSIILFVLIEITTVVV